MECNVDERLRQEVIAGTDNRFRERLVSERQRERDRRSRAAEGRRARAACNVCKKVRVRVDATWKDVAAVRVDHASTACPGRAELGDTSLRDPNVGAANALRGDDEAADDLPNHGAQEGGRASENRGSPSSGMGSHGAA